MVCLDWRTKLISSVNVFLDWRTNLLSSVYGLFRLKLTWVNGGRIYGLVDLLGLYSPVWSFRTMLCKGHKKIPKLSQFVLEETQISINTSSHNNYKFIFTHTIWGFNQIPQNFIIPMYFSICWALSLFILTWWAVKKLLKFKFIAKLNICMSALAKQYIFYVLCVWWETTIKPLPYLLVLHSKAFSVDVSLLQ